MRPTPHRPALLTAAAAALVLSALLAFGCGRDELPVTVAQALNEPDDTSLAPAAEPAAEDPAASPLEDATALPATPPPAELPPAVDAAAVTDRERDLVQRAARVARREAEIAEREADLAARESELEILAEPAPAPPASDDTDGRIAGAGEGFEPVLDEPAGREPASWETVVVPAGTVLDVELLETVSSATSASGDVFRARVVRGVDAGGLEAIPRGSLAIGEVIEAVPLRRIGGRARLVLDFYRLEPPDGEPVAITADFSAQGKGETKRDAATIGGAAVGGAILGRILDRDHKDRGTAVGAAVGAAAGTVIAARTEGQEVELAAGTPLELVLTEPVTLRIRR